MRLESGKRARSGIAEFLGFFGGELKAVGGEPDGGRDDALAGRACRICARRRPGRRPSRAWRWSGSRGRWSRESRCPWRPGTWFRWRRAGAFSRKSMKVVLPSWVRSSRKPPPPRLPAAGCTTASAKPVATAASTALPPCAQHLHAGIGCQMMDADHHAVPRAHRLLVGGGGCGLLGGECGRTCGDREEGGGAKASACRYRRMAPHHGAARITLPRRANGSQ